MSPTVKPIPRYVELTPEKEKKIDELLEKITTRMNPLPPLLVEANEKSKLNSTAPTTKNPTRLYAYMFLNSREWDVEKAYKMVEEVATYRAQNHLDDGSMLPSAFSVRGWDENDILTSLHRTPRANPGRFDRICGGVDAHFSAGFHFWDREGLPVLYFMVGNADEAGLLAKLKEMANIRETASGVLWEYTQHAIGVGEELVMYQQHRLDKGELQQDGVDASAGNIRSITIVADANGLNYTMLWKPALDLFRDTMKNLFRFYPDCVHRVMVVNCPSMVMFAYKIVKGVFNEQVQKKISFYYPKDTLEALQVVIDKRYIPSFLGGTCSCVANCICSFNPAHPERRIHTLNDVEDGVVTEDVVISAGQKYKKLFELKEHDEVVWEFVTAKEKDVTFKVYFVPPAASVALRKSKDSNGEFFEKEIKDYLVAKDCLSEGTDSYKAMKCGTLMLVWDNKSSWVKSASIQMKVYKNVGSTVDPSG